MLLALGLGVSCMGIKDWSRSPTICSASSDVGLTNFILLARSMAMDKEEGRNAERLGSLSQSLGLRYTHRLAHTCISESYDKRTLRMRLFMRVRV